MKMEEEGRQYENGGMGIKVMTDEQLEMLRKQISVYSTICDNLVQLHKSICSLHDFSVIQPPASSLYGYTGPFGMQRVPARQRWAPKATQLQMLESVFEKCNATPGREKIRELTSELAKHGPISETNVYNWFQNRRARSKRKQALPQTRPRPKRGGVASEAQPEIEPLREKDNNSTTNEDETSKAGAAQIDESFELFDMYLDNPEVQGIENLIGQPEVSVNYNAHWPGLFGNDC